MPYAKQPEPLNKEAVAFEQWWREQHHALEMSPSIKFAAWNGWLARSSAAVEQSKEK